MILKYAISLAILLVLAASFTWAFLPARHLPGNRARHLRIRLHLRLHPGKGFAHLFSLWLRWGRLAALRRSGRVRPSLPLWYRIADPNQHSVFLGRAHYRHALRAPLEEHLLVMAPPRTFKTAFLADVILCYPGPVIATSTKADIYALTAAARAGLGPVHVFKPSTLVVSLIFGVVEPRGPGAIRHCRRRRYSPSPCRRSRGGCHLWVCQGLGLSARLSSCCWPRPGMPRTWPPGVRRGSGRRTIRRAGRISGATLTELSEPTTR